jgi:hypothetical protein
MYAEEFIPFDLDDPGLARELRRTHLVGAWYDEQVLAEASGGSLSPSGIVGTIVPNPDLGRYEKGAFLGTWLPTAEVWLTEDNTFAGTSGTNPYSNSFHFEITASLGEPNRVSMCEEGPGPGQECEGLPTDVRPCGDGAWWARVEGAGRTDGPLYRCIKRCPYDFVVPGTVRWSWDARDEGIWMRCENGCCELGPGDE